MAPRPKRVRQCNRPEFTILKAFDDSEGLPFEECGACPVLRQRGEEFLCGFVMPDAGRYVNSPQRIPVFVRAVSEIATTQVIIRPGEKLRVCSLATVGYWVKQTRSGKSVTRDQILVREDQVEQDVDEA